jgi:hypothetical protein
MPPYAPHLLAVELRRAYHAVFIPHRGGKIPLTQVHGKNGVVCFSYFNLLLNGYVEEPSFLKFKELCLPYRAIFRKIAVGDNCNPYAASNSTNGYPFGLS